MIILPTADIVQDCQEFEPVFCFYNNGIKGLVRDIVDLAASPHYDDEIAAFKDMVMSEYDQSINRRYLENTHQGMAQDFMIEMVIEQIAHGVQELFQQFFKQMIYRVDNTEKWLGNDLLTTVRIAHLDLARYGHSRIDQRRSLFL